MAIQKNDMESVLFLLSIHVDVNSRVQDATQTPPLHLAAASGSEMLVRSLLLAGARVSSRKWHFLSVSNNRSFALNSSHGAGAILFQGDSPHSLVLVLQYRLALLAPALL